jgi:ABC-2 type transport system ATP-binding protein
VIEFRNVSKTYTSILGRSVKAVEDFSLSVAAGEVLGVAGPNGAGKSTLIAMLLGYIKPTAGAITVGGKPPRAYVEDHGVGYLSELINIPPRWRADGALERYAVLSGVPEARLAASVDASVEKLGLEEHRKKSIKALSKGNLQRVGMAQALAEPADVFILDEPTHGLDPVWTQRFRDIVTGLRRPERAVILASHNLDELERLCDRVAIIDHGMLQRVVKTRVPGDDSAATTYRVCVASGAEKVSAAFPGAKAQGNGEFELAGVDLAGLNRTLATLMLDGVVVTSIAPAHSALEREFREAVAR